ncbi:PP2C family protein-serine/threonine phosphatase [Desulfovibrio sp. QI0434]
MSTDSSLNNYQYDYFSIPKQGKKTNEDSLMLPFLHHDGIYFAIADGVGGNGNGDIASKLAIDICKKILSSSIHISMHALLENIWNEYIEYLRPRRKYINAATTLTICKICDQNMTIGHIGDCRVYILKNKHISRITNDHTLSNVINVHELKKYKHNFDNIITSSLSYNKYTADVIQRTLQPESIIIICSDGVYKTFSDRTILSFFPDYKKAKDGFENMKKQIKSLTLKDDCTMIFLADNP